MKMATAAAYLDMNVSTFRVLWPVLVAKFGLPDPAKLARRRFSRAELDKAIARVAKSGAELTTDKNTSTARVNGLAVAIA